MNPTVSACVLLGALSLLLLLAFWLALALGPVSLPLLDTLQALWQLSGLPAPGGEVAQAGVHGDAGAGAGEFGGHAGQVEPG